MELKPLKSDDFKNLIDSFNRTFMELKLLNFKGIGELEITFNRTFMELKLAMSRSSTPKRPLLIAPLWN